MDARTRGTTSGRTARAGTLLLLLHLLVGTTAAAPGPLPGARTAEAAARVGEWRQSRGGVQVLDPLLEARIEALRRESPSFALAWERLRESGVPVLVGTREQTQAVLPARIRRSEAWVGMTTSWGGEGERLERAAVSVRLEWLRALHRSLGSPEEAFVRALDDLLVHEIYGHLVPAVEARSARVVCADPAPGERLAQSCVGRRELALRGEREEHAAHRLASGAALSRRDATAPPAPRAAGPPPPGSTR